MTRTLPPGFYTEIPSNGETSRFLTRCTKCKARHAIDIPVRYASTFYTLSFNGFPDSETRQTECIRCSCGRGLTMWKQVRGKVGVKKCDARCTGATGPDCECQCGGDNHGADNL